MTTRIVVHLGPIKTGTTAFARYLTAASARGVLPEDIVYPMEDLWFGRTGSIVKHRDELDVMRRQVGGSPRFRNAKTHEALVSLAEKMHDVSGSIGKPVTTFLVAETAGVRQDASALSEALAAIFDEVVFVIMVRSQARATASVVAQRAKMWEVSPASLDPRRHFARGDIDLAGLDYAQLHAKWRPRAGEHVLVMLPFLEDDHSSFRMIARIFTAVGLAEPVPTKGIEGRRIHPTFSADGMKALVRAKRGARLFSWYPGATDRFKKRFEMSIETYHESAITEGIEPSGKPFEPWSLGRAATRWTVKRFSDSNRVLLSEVDRRGFEHEWKAWEEAL